MPRVPAQQDSVPRPAGRDIYFGKHGFTVSRAAPFWHRIGRAPWVYLPRRSGRLFLMNKFFQWFVAVLVVVCGDSASQAVQIDANFAGRISVRDIDNGVISGASNATQLAFGPGPDPDRLYLYMSSNSRGVRRAVYDPVTGLSGLTTILPNIRGNGVAFRTNSSGQNEMYLSEPYSTSNPPWVFSTVEGCR